jgi:hypothetical protein
MEEREDMERRESTDRRSARPDESMAVGGWLMERRDDTMWSSASMSPSCSCGTSATTCCTGKQRVSEREREAAWRECRLGFSHSPVKRVVGIETRRSPKHDSLAWRKRETQLEREGERGGVPAAAGWLCWEGSQPVSPAASRWAPRHPA